MTKFVISNYLDSNEGKKVAGFSTWTLNQNILCWISCVSPMSGTGSDISSY